MMLQQIEIGDILTDVEERKSYRIIYFSEDFIEVCALGSTHLELSFLPISKIREKILSQELTHEKGKMNVVDLSLMSEEEKAKFTVKKEIINKINACYGPTYEDLMGKKKKVHVLSIAKEYSIPKESIRRLYIKYIQSGCCDYGLLDSRYTSNRKQKRKEYEYTKKPGRKSENAYSSQIIVTKEVREQFDEAIKYFKSGRAKTIEGAYEWLCTQYYSQEKLVNGVVITTTLPVTELPTLKQFYYYIEKNISIEEKDIIKTSKREQRNDKRPLLGDALNGVLGPGDLAEIDAVEVDVSLVSEVDRTNTVGRPVIYIMIDVYTRTILAMSISFDNNSELALTNCFLNLVDDKVNYCNKFGITITEDMWKSNIIPRRIRCDRGADFRSKAFSGVCNNLGIDRQLVSAATGSLKGTVEQVFHQLHSAQNMHLEDKGLIEKRYDSKHHKEATLTITEYTRMAISFVLMHNSKHIDKYPLTKDMIEHGIQNRPLDLWNYGCSKYGVPRPISNKNQFIYDLLVPCKASLNKRGIKANGLYYMNWNDDKLTKEMYKQQNKVLKIEVRYDPRDVGYVYYIRDGELQVAELNQGITGNADYKGMTYKDLKEYQKKKKQLQMEGKNQNRQLKNSLFMINGNIVDTASKNQPTYASDKDLREKRENEKQMISQRNSAIQHAEKKEKATYHIEKSEAEPRKTQPENFIDALDDFEDD